MVAESLSQRCKEVIWHADSLEFFKSSQKELPPHIDLSKLNNPLRLAESDYSSVKFESNECWELVAEQNLGMFLILSERVALGRWDVNTKIFFFKFLLNYWRDTFVEHNVSHVIFQATPHLPADFACMVAAKQLKIPYVFPSRTHLGLAVQFRTELEGTNVAEFLKRSHFNLDNNFTSPWLQRSKEQNLEVTAPNTPKEIFEQGIPQIFQEAKKRLQFLRLSLEIVISKRWNQHFLYLNRIQSMKVIVQSWMSQRKLERFLVKNSVSKNNFKEQFCFFPLQYQPEKTTQPESKWFNDQISSILYLRSNLPIDLPIVVKEHPKVFRRNPRNPNFLMYRSINYYQTLLKIPNVLFAHPHEDSEEWISKSSLIASATGSAIWEGLQYGIPGLSFAKNWHSEFEFSPFIFDLKDVKNYLSSSLSVSRQDIQKKLGLFKKKALESSIHTVDNEKIFSIVKEYDLDYVKLVENYANFLLNFVSRK